MLAKSSLTASLVWDAVSAGLVVSGLGEAAALASGYEVVSEGQSDVALAFVVVLPLRNPFPIS